MKASSPHLLLSAAFAAALVSTALIAQAPGPKKELSQAVLDGVKFNVTDVQVIQEKETAAKYAAKAGSKLLCFSLELESPSDKAPKFDPKRLKCDDLAGQTMMGA